MKRCARCGNENTDEMRFCLECGSPLPAAPIVINLHGGGEDAVPPPQKKRDVKTDSFDRSVNTQAAGRYPPTYQSAANRPRRSNTKIFLAVGGAVALLALLFTGVAAIVIYNLMSQERADVTPTPTPAPERTVEKDATPTPDATATPTPAPTRASKTPTLKEDNSDVTVKFDGIDVDYNTRQNGRPGMLMRVNFTVTGMKGMDSYLAIHIQRRDGTALAAGPGEYRDVNGNLAVFRTLRPDYDETEYKDLELFLPYDEFDLPRGRHDLKLDVDLLDGKGVAIEHLAYEEFWYEQK